MRPESEGELAALLRDRSTPVEVQGGGTRTLVHGGVAETLSSTGLQGIELYEPGALTLVVRAGTPLAMVEAALAAERQRLAFEPPDLRGLLGRQGESTIGGVFAANASGPRRVQAGAARDHLLGVRFVDGTGTVVKNGGRVMKNVTGYDLVKLMAGSHGTLGVLTEVALKVQPLPETSATLTLHRAGRRAAFDAMARAMTGPFDVTGAAFLPAGQAVHLRVDGFAGSVAYRAGRLRDLLRDLGEVTVEEDPSRGAAIWQGIRDVAPLQGSTCVWRVSMAAGAMERGLLPAIEGLADFDHLIDWAGGLCWIGLRDTEGAEAFHTALQSAVAEKGGGHATQVRAQEDLRARLSLFQPEAPGVAALTRGLRARFDPRGVLNPGLMG